MRPLYQPHSITLLPNGIASVESWRGWRSRRVSLMYQQTSVGQTCPMRAQRLYAVRFAQSHPCIRIEGKRNIR